MELLICVAETAKSFHSFFSFMLAEYIDTQLGGMHCASQPPLQLAEAIRQSFG